MFRRPLVLIKTSLSVLRRDKFLFLFPVLAVLTGLVTAGILVSIVGNLNLGFNHHGFPKPGIALFFCGLVVLTVPMYFIIALIAAANERMAGESDPNMGSALRGAAACFQRTYLWIVISAAIALLLEGLRKHGTIGIVLYYLGLAAFTLPTYLVLPMLVVEEVGLVDALVRSAGLLPRVWKDICGGWVILFAGMIIMSLPFLIFGFIVFLIKSNGLIIPAVIAGNIGMFLVFVLASVVSAIFGVALYRFATNQPISPEVSYVLYSSPSEEPLAPESTAV